MNRTSFSLMCRISAGVCCQTEPSDSDRQGATTPAQARRSSPVARVVPASDVPGKREVIPAEEVQVLVEERRESPDINVPNCGSVDSQVAQYCICACGPRWIWYCRLGYAVHARAPDHCAASRRSSSSAAADLIWNDDRVRGKAMPKDGLTIRRGRRPAGFCQEQTHVILVHAEPTTPLFAGVRRAP